MSEARLITDRLTAAYTSLSPQLKRAARYVLDSPDDVALLSMRAVAARAGVKPATMSRLARQLRFDDYAGFREPFRDQLRKRPDRMSARARDLQARQAEEDASRLIDEIVNADLNALRGSYDETTAQNAAAAATLVDGARRIFVVGMRKCFPVAYFFHYACRMLRLPAVLIKGMAGTFDDELWEIDDGDVLIAIGFDPYTRETVTAVDRAREAGAGVIAITDSKVAPIGDGARHVFVAGNDSPSFFRSLVGALSIAQMLVAFLAQRRGPAAVEALAASEQALAKQGAYWRPARMK